MSRREILQRVAVVLAVLACVYQLPFFLQRGIALVASTTFQLLFVFAWLWILTSGTRTISITTTVVYWLVGVYPVMLLSLGAGLPVANLFGLDGHFVRDFWVPIAEELIKALPVGLFFILATRSADWKRSASDGLLIGYAVGAGMTFHEDVMWGETWGGGVGAAPPWSWLFSTIRFDNGADALGLNHTEYTALVGVAIGLFFFLRTRNRGIRLVVPAALLLALAAHIFANWVMNSGGATAPLLIRGLHALLLGGRLPVVILLLAAVIAVVVERKALRSTQDRAVLFPPPPIGTIVDSWWWPAVRRPRISGLQRLVAICDYIRLRRAALYAVWESERDSLTEEASRTLFGLLMTSGCRVRD